MSSLLERAKKGRRKKTAPRPDNWVQQDIEAAASLLPDNSLSERANEAEAEADDEKIYTLPIITVQKNFKPEKAILREMATVVTVTEGLTFDCFVEALFAHYRSLDSESKAKVLDDGRFRRSLRLKYQGQKTRKLES